MVEPAGDRRTVLIVEDNEKNLKLARDLLRIGGFAVIEATAGRQGVELARSRRPHLVIMDIQLPDIDGWEALRMIRGDPAAKDLVVVAVTAYAASGEQDRFLEGGFDGYMTKPINVRTFSRTIGAFCSCRKRPEEG